MARREAWDALPSSPNEYYHSFLPPGEKPAAGADWSAKELNNFELLLAIDWIVQRTEHAASKDTKSPLRRDRFITSLLRLK